MEFQNQTSKINSREKHVFYVYNNLFHYTFDTFLQLLKII